MSHADRLSQLYNNRKDVDLSFIGQCMTDEIDMRIMEFVRTYDPADVAYMPHVFPAKLERWAYIIEQVAAKADDPVSALESSMRALSYWSRECQDALTFDWDHQTRIFIGDSDEPTKVSQFEREKLLYVARNISDPEGALKEAIDAQKKYGLQARDTAVATFCKLARQYPAETLAALNSMPEDRFDRMKEYLSEVLDFQELKTELAAAIPAGYTVRSKKHTPPSPEFF